MSVPHIEHEMNAAVGIAFQWDDDWPARLEEFIDPWPSETAMLKMLYEEIFSF